MVVQASAACDEETQPITVTLLVGETALPMTAVVDQRNRYSAALDAQTTLTADQDYPLIAQWRCPNETAVVEEYLGVLQVAGPIALDEAPNQLFLPLVTK